MPLDNGCNQAISGSAAPTHSLTVRRLPCPDTKRESDFARDLRTEAIHNVLEFSLEQLIGFRPSKKARKELSKDLKKLFKACRYTVFGRFGPELVESDATRDYLVVLSDGVRRHVPEQISIDPRDIFGTLVLPYDSQRRCHYLSLEQGTIRFNFPARRLKARETHDLQRIIHEQAETVRQRERRRTGDAIERAEQEITETGFAAATRHPGRRRRQATEFRRPHRHWDRPRGGRDAVRRTGLTFHGIP
ncbi:MAG TPA: hypothetical protein VMV79_02110 [Alphaproteobacteria bacterium]|nr:hypothetical protein [Alphaproteobacteria bacterium]